MPIVFIATSHYTLWHTLDNNIAQTIDKVKSDFILQFLFPAWTVAFNGGFI